MAHEHTEGKNDGNDDNDDDDGDDDDSDDNDLKARRKKERKDSLWRSSSNLPPTDTWGKTQNN